MTIRGTEWKYSDKAAIGLVLSKLREEGWSLGGDTEIKQAGVTATHVHYEVTGKLHPYFHGRRMSHDDFAKAFTRVTKHLSLWRADDNSLDEPKM